MEKVALNWTRKGYELTTSSGTCLYFDTLPEALTWLNRLEMTHYGSEKNISPYCGRRPEVVIFDEFSNKGGENE